MYSVLTVVVIVRSNVSLTCVYLAVDFGIRPSCRCYSASFRDRSRAVRRGGGCPSSPPTRRVIPVRESATVTPPVVPT